MAVGSTRFQILGSRIFLWRFRDFHRNEFFTDPGLPFEYFAPGAVLYSALYAFGWHSCVSVYLLAAATSIGTGVRLLGRAMLRSGIARGEVYTFLLVAILTSYPVLFTLERGNVEMLLASGMALGTWAYWKGHTWAAALLWGIFGSVKIFPLLLAAVFISRRQNRQLIVTIASAVFANILSTFYVGPTFFAAAQGLHGGTRVFLRDVTLAFYGVGLDHSFFMILKLLTIPLHPRMDHLLVGYLALMSTVLLVLFFTVVRKLPLANQLLVLSICLVTFPPTSFDYTLIQLYAPWTILVLLAVRSSAISYRVPGLRACIVLFSMLFSTTGFFVVHRIAYSAQVKSFLLLLLLLFAMFNPLEAPRSGGEQDLG